MIEHTSAEIRQMYREVNPDMPSDEVLRYRYGDAVTGAAQWLDEQKVMREWEMPKPIAELTDSELDGLRRIVYNSAHMDGDV